MKVKEKNKDVVEEYQGKWACMYVWKEGSSVGERSFDHRGDVFPMSKTGKTLDELMANDCLSRVKGVKVRWKNLLFWQPIPKGD